jgi:hypothetical protein
MQDVEQRSTERIGTHLTGTLLLLDRVATCVITDLSPTGARLKVSASLLLPSSFALYVSEHCTGYRVILRWRESDEVGVEIANATCIPTVREWSQHLAALDVASYNSH